MPFTVHPVDLEAQQDSRFFMMHTSRQPTRVDEFRVLGRRPPLLGECNTLYLPRLDCINGVFRHQMCFL